MTTNNYKQMIKEIDDAILAKKKQIDRNLDSLFNVRQTPDDEGCSMSFSEMEIQALNSEIEQLNIQKDQLTAEYYASKIKTKDLKDETELIQALVADYDNLNVKIKEEDGVGVYSLTLRAPDCVGITPVTTEVLLNKKTLEPRFYTVDEVGHLHRINLEHVQELLSVIAIIKSVHQRKE